MINISVIIPTYKPGPYLRECLISLYRQTLEKSSYQILLILNGCNEPYRSELDTFISTHLVGLDIELIQTDAPGVSNARNLGLRRMRGQYVAFVDDDDVLSANYLEGLQSVAGEEIVAVSNVKTFTHEIDITSDDYISRAFSRYYGKGPLKSLQMRKFLSSACAKLISRKIIGGHRFDPKLKKSEDAIFMLQISCNIKSIKLSSPEVIYYRRLRQESASRVRGSWRDINTNYFHAVRKSLACSLKKPFEYNHLLVLLKSLALVWYYLKLISR